MFWLTPDEIELILSDCFYQKDMTWRKAIDVLMKVQLHKLWEWGAEVCDIHHSGVCRIDCQKCIKNIKKELGI